MNCEPEALGPENPHAIGFCAKETELTHELAAIRNVNAESSRIWKIKNESVRNRLTGLSTAYTLYLPSNAFRAQAMQHSALLHKLHPLTWWHKVPSGLAICA